MTVVDPPLIDQGPQDPLVRGLAAFQADTPAAHLSRAGQLLSLGTFLRGDSAQTDALRSDAEELAVPFVYPIPRGERGSLLDLQLHEALFRAFRNGPDRDEQARVTRRASRDALKVALWRNIDALRDPLAAVALLRVSSSEEYARSEIERVAAAAALHGLGSESEGSLLSDLCTSENDLVADIARAALGDAAEPVREESVFPPGDDAEPVMEESSGSRQGGHSMSVHGTWSRVGPVDFDWWRPQSALSTLIRHQATPSLYSGRDYFRWTGGYSHYDRENAAEDLVDWQRSRGIASFDTVFAHSHGGNVALSALDMRGPCALLVLMHTPVLRRTLQEWRAVAKRVDRVLDMRTRMDLVVLADGLRTGSTSRLPRALPHRRVRRHWKEADAWFSHTFFVEEDSWVRYDLANDVSYERRRAGYSATTNVWPKDTIERELSF